MITACTRTCGIFSRTTGRQSREREELEREVKIPADIDGNSVSVCGRGQDVRVDEKAAEILLFRFMLGRPVRLSHGNSDNWVSR